MIRQTKSQILGRKGERWFESLVPSNWIYQLPREDIGIDGHITIGSDTHTGGLDFNVQVKAKSKYPIKDGCITFSEIKRETSIYLGSRMRPTLYIFYDAELNRGYYSWHLEMFEDINDLLFMKKKSLTVKIPASNILDDMIWTTIESYVLEFYEQLDSSLFLINTIERILPTVHALSRGLNILYLCEFSDDPADENELNAKRISEMAAHKENIRTLVNLKNQFDKMTIPIKGIEQSISDYIAELRLFVNGVDEFLEGDKATCIFLNEEEMKKRRPKLMWMINNIITCFSNNPPNDVDERYDLNKKLIKYKSEKSRD